MIARCLLPRPGYFVDLSIEEFNVPAYISAVTAQSLSLVFRHPRTRELQYSDLLLEECQPVFTVAALSWITSYDGLGFLEQLAKLGYAESALRGIEAVSTTTENREESTFQLFSCMFPLVSMGRSLPADLIISHVTTVAQVYSSFLRSILTSQSPPLWLEVTYWVPRVFRALSTPETAHAVMQAFEDAGYFQAVFSLLSDKACLPQLVLSLAEASLIALTNRRDLRFQLLTCYKKYLKKDKVMQLWAATKNSFPFFSPLESMFAHEQETFEQFFQELFAVLVSSADEQMFKYAVLLLKNAVTNGKEYAKSVFSLRENVERIANSKMCAAAGAEVSEIFAHLMNKNSLSTVLESMGEGVVNFAQPAIVFPMIEKKDWKSIAILVENGFRFSSLSGNDDTSRLLLYCAIGRTIPVSLFQKLMDVETHPIMEAYYLIQRRYGKQEQMAMLHALAPSHKKALLNINALQRGREDVEAMLELFEVFNPRLQMMWVLERLPLARRIPRGLVMCLVLEFAYPIRW